MWTFAMLLGCGHTSPNSEVTSPAVTNSAVTNSAVTNSPLSIHPPPQAPPTCNLQRLPEQLLEGSLVDTLPEVGETTFALVSHPTQGTGMVTRGQLGPIVAYSTIHAATMYVDGLDTYFLATYPARLAVIN